MENAHEQRTKQQKVNFVLIFVAIILNIDFASSLHADAWKSGDLWIVTMGDHASEHLFIEKDAQEDREVECSIDHADPQVHGCSVDVSRRWYRFQVSSGIAPYRTAVSA